MTTPAFLETLPPGVQLVLNSRQLRVINSALLNHPKRTFIVDHYTTIRAVLRLRSLGEKIKEGTLPTNERTAAGLGQLHCRAKNTTGYTLMAEGEFVYQTAAEFDAGAAYRGSADYQAELARQSAVAQESLEEGIRGYRGRNNGLYRIEIRFAKLRT